jgi:hypothetical protein
MGLLDFFKRRKLLTPDQVRATVTFDATGVICRFVNGEVQSIEWRDLRSVVIRTTSDGPFVDDIFWNLTGDTGCCVVPSESFGMKELMKRLGDLPGFNDEAVIAAMCCAEDKEFSCWQAESDTASSG